MQRASNCTQKCLHDFLPLLEGIFSSTSIYKFCQACSKALKYKSMLGIQTVYVKIKCDRVVLNPWKQLKPIGHIPFTHVFTALHRCMKSLSILLTTNRASFIKNARCILITISYIFLIPELKQIKPTSSWQSLFVFF